MSCDISKLFTCEKMVSQYFVCDDRPLNILICQNPAPFFISQIKSSLTYNSTFHIIVSFCKMNSSQFYYSLHFIYKFCYIFSILTSNLIIYIYLFQKKLFVYQIIFFLYKKSQCTKLNT